MYPSISIEHLAKVYHLRSSRAKGYSTLREDLWGRLSGPRRLQTEEFWALRDINLQVDPGEVMGVVGANGAGKSTLLKILARVTRPSQGRAVLRGRVASLLEVGTGFHPELTGRENIYVSGAVLGMQRQEIKRKFDQIVAFAETEKFLDTPVKRYSSGMYVRLAFAVAAHLESEILLVDEVLAVGDAAFQKKCLGTMERVVQESGRTIMFISHNMAAIERTCSRALLIRQGAIVQVGAPREVIRAYLKDSTDLTVQWSRSQPTVREAYFRRVWLIDQATHHPPECVLLTSRLSVGLEFTLREPLDDLRLSCMVADDLGEPIFVSMPQDSGLECPRRPGEFLATVELPAGVFLEKRTYKIIPVLYGHRLYDRVDALQFPVYEEDSWQCVEVPGGRHGKLAIPCTWTMKAQESLTTGLAGFEPST